MKGSYVLITGLDAEALESRVNARIQLGFEPIGGIAVVCRKIQNTRDAKDEDLCFYQSMIKKGGINV